MLILKKKKTNSILKSLSMDKFDALKYEKKKERNENKYVTI